MQKEFSDGLQVPICNHRFYRGEYSLGVSALHAVRQRSPSLINPADGVAVPPVGSEVVKIIFE